MCELWITSLRFSSKTKDFIQITYYTSSLLAQPKLFFLKVQGANRTIENPIFCEKGVVGCLYQGQFLEYSHNH